MRLRWNVGKTQKKELSLSTSVLWNLFLELLSTKKWIQTLALCHQYFNHELGCLHLRSKMEWIPWVLLAFKCGKMNLGKWNEFQKLVLKIVKSGKISYIFSTIWSCISAPKSWSLISHSCTITAYLLKHF
jgi:hypothetical protein